MATNCRCDHRMVRKDGMVKLTCLIGIGYGLRMLIPIPIQFICGVDVSSLTHIEADNGRPSEQIYQVCSLS